MIPQRTIDPRTACHSCSSGRDADGNVCARCKGEGLRDAREAAAHKAYLAAREAETEAIAAYKRAGQAGTAAAYTAGFAAARDVDLAFAARKKARDVWENELARVAAERVMKGAA